MTPLTDEQLMELDMEREDLADYTEGELRLYAKLADARIEARRLATELASKESLLAEAVSGARQVNDELREGRRAIEEARRLREENGKLKDAERVAWATCAMLRWQLGDGSDTPLTLGISDDGFWVLARGEDRHSAGYCRAFCGNGLIPALADEARAIVDAAMRAESEAPNG